MEDKKIKSILANSFGLDCLKIVLKQNISSQEKKIYKGSGTISQSQNDYFSLKLFCAGKVTVDEVLFESTQKPGEIIEDSCYYSLNAIDTEGNNWKADSIKTEISACQGIDAFIVNGKFLEIICKKNISKSFSKNHLSLIFRGNIDIPCNKYSQTEIVIDGGKRKKSFKLNVAEFSACGFNFTITKEEGFLLLNTYSDSIIISDSIITRIIEALQLILARPLLWPIIEIQQQKTVVYVIRLPLCGKNKSSIQPPIAFHSCCPNENVWKLFEKYLKHVSDYQDGKNWHPIFSLINKVIKSGNSSIEVQALILAVSIEGLLDSFFSNIIKTNREEKKQLKKAQAIISESALDQNMKNRIFEYLSTMLNPRAIDRLSKLENDSIIEKELIAAWKKLRHPAAHGVLNLFSDVQKSVDRINSILVLFYKLIFLVIGYYGEYTDYSIHGYPTKVFERKK